MILHHFGHHGARGTPFCDVVPGQPCPVHLHWLFLLCRWIHVHGLYAIRWGLTSMSLAGSQVSASNHSPAEGGLWSSTRSLSSACFIFLGWGHMVDGPRNGLCLIPLALLCHVLLFPSMLHVGITSCSAAGVPAFIGPWNGKRGGGW